VIAGLGGIVLGLRFGWKSSLPQLILVAIMILSFEIMGLIILFYRVAVNEQDFVVYKFLKIPKKYEYNQVDEGVIVASKDLHVFVKGKRVVNVDGAALGRKEFQKTLEKNGVTIKVKEVKK